MNFKTTASAIGLIATGCGDPNDRCPDGVYDRTVVLTDDGFLFEQGATLFSSGKDETVPYSASPFLNCRVIGGIVMRTANAVLDSDHYPMVEELGGITIEPLDSGGDRIVDDLSGFENVIRFGGIGNPWALTRQASVREFSGFNRLEVIDGSLLTNGTVTGLRSVKIVEGTLDVANVVDQKTLERVGSTLDIGAAFDEAAFPSLNSIGGDLRVVGSRLTEVGFPALRVVGGDVLLESNDRFERWAGFAAGAVIEGDFRARSNSPIRDSVFEEWVAGDVTINGDISICGNRPPGEAGGCFE
jgi:hypothetical protein